MKGCLDEPITKALLLDLHMSKNVLVERLKEHLLKAKKIHVHVVGPLRKIAFENKIAPLDSQKSRHMIK